MAVLKNRADLERELSPRMLAVALPAALFGEIGDLLGVALGTMHFAVRPTNGNHEAFAVLFGGKVLNRFL